MDRQAKRKFDEFKSDTDIESTYQPWLDLEANTLATQAGHAAPYPGTQEPPPDNGEQMLGDYLVAQVNPYCSCSGFSSTKFRNCNKTSHPTPDCSARGRNSPRG